MSLFDEYRKAKKDIENYMSGFSHIELELLRFIYHNDCNSEKKDLELFRLFLRYKGEILGPQRETKDIMIAYNQIIDKFKSKGLIKRGWYLVDEDKFFTIHGLSPEEKLKVHDKKISIKAIMKNRGAVIRTILTNLGKDVVIWTIKNNDLDDYVEEVP